MLSLRPAAQSLIVLTALGCANRAAVFSGQQQEPVAAAEAIGEHESMPAGYERLGTVRSGCSRQEPAFAELELGEAHGSTLSELLCSEELLAWTLRNKAASVGGTALVGRRCQRHGRDDDWDLSCSAQVGRGAGSGTPPAPFAREFPELPAVKHVDDAWRVRVVFTPNIAPWSSEPRPTQLVNEVVNLPPQDLVLGDLLASCEDCEPAWVREALRVAAGRLGGSEIAGVQCVHKGERLLCTGRVGVPRVDPRVVSAAR